MAKTTVEILGGQLDGTVLNNMASEATMRELLAAVKQNGGGGSGSGGNQNAGTSPAAKLRKSSSTMAKLADGLGNQIGNAIGAVGSMGAMLLTGNTKLSSYTRTLNDQVISKLPIFGGLLGGVGGLLNDSIEVLEEWNDSLKIGTSSGATFGNSILRASKAATNSAMGLDEFMRMISSNSSVMLNLGNTVTEGAERFSKMSRLLNRNGGLATQSLRQIGMSAQGINEAFIRYIDVAGLGMRNDAASDAKLVVSFEKFQLHLMQMGYMTGKTVKQLESQMAVANQDIVFKMAMSKLGTDEQAKMNTALASFTAQYGDAGAELFKALFLGMPPGNEDAQNLMVLVPQLTGAMKQSINSAKHGTGNIEKFTEQTEDAVIKTMIASAKAGVGLEGILAAAGVGVGDAEKFRRALTPILEQLSKHGDISKINTEQLRIMFREAKKESQARDELTKLLNDFEIAMKELKYKMMDLLLPLLNDLGIYLQREDLPGKVREFGELIKKSVEKYLPDVITFFKYLGSPDGREFIWNEIIHFFDKAAIHFEHHLREAFGRDDITDIQKDTKVALDKAEERYKAKQKKIEDRGNLPEKYKLNKSIAAKDSVVPGEEVVEPKSSVASPVNVDRTNLSNKLGHGGKLSSKMAGTVLHHTGGDNLEGAIKTLQQRNLSYNYLIDKDGKIHQLLPEGITAFHAGATVKMPNINNQNTIGVSLVGKDDKAVTPEQIEATKRLQTYLSSVYGYPVTSAFGHGDLSANKQETEGKTARDAIRSMGVKEHRTGTLGQYGSLFKDFGSGTDVILDGVEAVMTPDQMNSVITGAGNIATTEMLESLDRNFQRLANIMAERTSLSRSQLSYIEKNQVNIA